MLQHLGSSSLVQPPMGEPHRRDSAAFGSFFQEWLLHQEEYLRQLERWSVGGADLDSLLSQVLHHYREYYEEKSRAAQYNASQFFAPPWLSALEQTFLWIGGWKPGLAFRLVGSVSSTLSAEQEAAMEWLREETKRKEVELEKEHAMRQERLGSPKVMVAVAGELGKPRVNAERRQAYAMMEALQVSMEELLEAADALRAMTARKVMEILSPVQSAEFLAAAARLHFTIRRQGMRTGAEFRV